MPQFYVRYQVRLINAIGQGWAKSDVVEAEDEITALTAFRNKYQHLYDFLTPIECKKVEFNPTHRYLNIQTGEWEKVTLERSVDLCNAYVLKGDGSRWLVGKAFLEKI